MPFQSAVENLIRRPQQIVLFRDAPAGAGIVNTTLAADAAAGATTIVLQAGAGAGVAAGQAFRIGAGELLELVFAQTTPGADTVTLSRPLRLSHTVDTPVVEQIGYDLGDVDGDVSVNIGQESSDQASAMRLLPFTILRGNLSLGVTGRLLGTSLPNLAVALGIPYSRITGSGTVASPLCLQTDLSDVDSSANDSLVIVSQKQGGARVVHELWSLAYDYTGVSVQLARAQNGAVPFSVMGLSAFLQFDLAAGAALPFTAVNTNRGTQGKVFRELREVGVFELSGATTTLNDEGGSGAAGENALTVTANIPTLTAGDFVAFGTDDLIEVHQVDSHALTALAIRTPLLRTQLNGTIVQEVTKVPFLTVAPGGVTLTVGGSTTPIYNELRDLPIGMQQNTAQGSVSFATMDLLVANIARALGVPASQVSGGGALLSRLVASRRLVAFYAEGVTQDGTFCRLMAWGTTQEVQSFALTLGASNPAQVPFVVRPASGLSLTQWTV
jgi:hypothetical protein